MILTDLFPKTVNPLEAQSLFIRLVEEKISAEYDKDYIQSPVHLSIGQEAVAVGVCEALRESDSLFINYRGHAFYLARQGDLYEFFAELAGKHDGISKGKAGSMHLSSPRKNIIGASAVVNSSLSNAAGFAMAEKLNGTQNVTTVVIGDGATEQGSFHETLNFSALYTLPLLIICEDNGLAVHSPISERHAYDHSTIAEVYGIQSNRLLDGIDPKKVLEVVRQARSFVERTGKPFFQTICTSRYYEHVGPGTDFTAGYRSADQVEERKKRDPVEILRNKHPEVVALTQERINEVFDRAMSAEPSRKEELCTDVY